jgi:hypothetical protein
MRKRGRGGSGMPSALCPNPFIDGQRWGCHDVVADAPETVGASISGCMILKEQRRSGCQVLVIDIRANPGRH